MSQSSGVISKRNARIAAVQFMYHLQVIGGDSFSDIDLAEFVNTYVRDKVDMKFLKKLVASFFQKEVSLDKIIEEALENGKAVSNSPLVESCIIKTALTEMIFEKTDIPIIINEYVEIAKDFLDISGAKFVNALLDKISKKVERRCQKKA